MTVTFVLSLIFFFFQTFLVGMAFGLESILSKAVLHTAVCSLTQGK